MNIEEKSTSYPKHLGSGKYELSDGSTVKGYSNAKEKENILMLEKSNFTAVYEKSVQIGPESWKIEYRTKQISHDTTIGELQKWYAKNERNRPMNISINEERT